MTILLLLGIAVPTRRTQPANNLTDFFFDRSISLLSFDRLLCKSFGQLFASILAYIALTLNGYQVNKGEKAA